MLQREDLPSGLVVSCQPVPGGPMDAASFVVGFAQAAVAAGAVGLRIESAAYLAAVRSHVNVPIIGIVKRDLPDSPVRITPFLEDVAALADAGADIIAFDATDRARPVSVEALTEAIRASGRLAMADCACLDDARRALEIGVDFVGSTLSGYTGGHEPVEPDLALVRAMRSLTPFVLAEGRIRTPEQARAAAVAGAHAVVVGSAITRTEHATGWFSEAVASAATAAGHEAVLRVLAIDIGGTKTAVALVEGERIVREAEFATARETGPEAWLSAVADASRGWPEHFGSVGIAATGVIRDGRWSALNPQTLPIPADFPLVERASSLFGGKPTVAVNDAQAAAWGEFRAGEAEGDLVFLTVSTGIGGGIVAGGRLLEGMAGSFGLVRGIATAGGPLEDEVSGRWIALQAREAGHDADAAGVFAQARAGQAWATSIVRQSAQRIAALCRDIQMMFDPGRIVIGGGIGLASGFLDAVRANLSNVDPRLRPVLQPARLGTRAGVLGVADLALPRHVNTNNIAAINEREQR